MVIDLILMFYFLEDEDKRCPEWAKEGKCLNSDILKKCPVSCAPGVSLFLCLLGKHSLLRVINLQVQIVETFQLLSWSLYETGAKLMKTSSFFYH